jgi:hypothetical protein
MTEDGPIEFFKARDAANVLGGMGKVTIQDNDLVQELLQELTGQLVNRYTTENKDAPILYVVEIPIPEELTALKDAGINAPGEYSVLGGGAGRFPLREVKSEYAVDPYTPSKENFAESLANSIAKKRGTGENSALEIKRQILNTLESYVEKGPSK